MQNRTEANLFINSLSFLVADESNGANEIKNFLKNYPDAVLEINTRSPNGTKIVESAARSGSVSSLQYLIEVLNADIKADELTPNLVEIALNNPPAREYLLEEDKKRWYLFADGTTDFLAHVMAGRLVPALNMLNDNPDLICSMNIRFQNALYWSHATKLNAATFKMRAEDYLVINLDNNQKLARYHAAMGYFKLLYQFPQKPLIAIEQFEISISYYKKAILENEHDVQVVGVLVRELSLTLLHSARLYSQLAKTQNADACCIEAIKYLRNIPENIIPDRNFILDSLLREHAENSYILDNFYFAQGEAIQTDHLDALTFFKKAIAYGEEAIRALGDISLKTSKDLASLTKSCDKLVMSYGAVKNSHQDLALARSESVEENRIVREFHLSESKRYKDLITTLLYGKETNNPANVIPLKPQSPKFFGRYPNGTNGIHVLDDDSPPLKRQKTGITVYPVTLKA